MRSRSQMLAVLVLCLATEAQGGVAYTSYGVGSVACSRWTDLKERGDLDVWSLRQWVLGYITAAGAHAEQRLPKSDPEALFLTAEGFCKAHPLDDVSDAAEYTLQQLKTKAQ